MQQEFKLGQLEALLFAAGEPLGVPQLAELLGLNKPQTWELLGQLQEEYNTEKRGLELREVAEGWQLCNCVPAARDPGGNGSNPRGEGGRRGQHTVGVGADYRSRTKGNGRTTHIIQDYETVSGSIRIKDAERPACHAGYSGRGCGQASAADFSP